MGSYSLAQVFVIEIVGTCILVFFGIAATANALLPGTKGHGIGHMGVSISFGLGLFVALQLLGHISGLFNPAIAFGMAIRGTIPWAEMGVSWAGQILGAFLAAILMWLSYYKHFQSCPPTTRQLPQLSPNPTGSGDRFLRHKGPGTQRTDETSSLDLEAAKDAVSAEENVVTPSVRPFDREEVPRRPLTRGSHVSEDQRTKLSVFATRPAEESHFYLAPLWTEFLGTFVLTFAALSISDQRRVFLAAPGDGADLYRTGLEPILIGIMLTGVFICLGGVTGPALNPARDLGPRIAHMILPIPGKGGSEWWYSWVPILGPAAGGIVGAQFNYAITKMLKSGVPKW